MNTLIIFFVLLITVIPVSAQWNKIGVELKIGGTSGLEGQVQSYFAREFREIGDVEVVDTGALIKVSILVIQQKNIAGNDLGYTISIAIADRSPVLDLAFMAQSSIADPEHRKKIDLFVPTEGILIDHLLWTLRSDTLQQSCRELAAKIDGTHLEKIRKWRLKIQKMIPAQQTK